LLGVLENKRRYLILVQRLNTRYFLIPLPNLFGYKLVLKNLESRRVVQKFFGVIILGRHTFLLIQFITHIPNILKLIFTLFKNRLLRSCSQSSSFLLRISWLTYS
jgi:hypothetical protein